MLLVSVPVTESRYKRGEAFGMCDSGPILLHKPLLGQLATCVLFEVCVLQRRKSTHAEIRV